MALVLAALVSPLMGFWRPAFVFPTALAGVAAATVAAVLALAFTLEGRQLRHHFGGWPPPLGIEYLMDSIAAFVAATVMMVAVLVVIATRRTALEEFREHPGPFYGLVLLLLAGITGMIVTHDLFNLFVFMEISSVAAYTLVFMGGPRAMIAGFRYLVLGSIGGGFFLLGVGFLYFATGTLNMSDVAVRLAALQDARAVLAGAAFIFTGLALKMALFPLHLWLPDAYTYAPSSVSAIIAPVMTKAAAFAMVRMFLSVFPPGYLTDVAPVSSALVGLGLAGMVVGSVAALRQRDYRRMLAHSSVSQLGIIGVGIGLATPLGFAVALLHIMNHAIMKACLFLVAASVRSRTGHSEVERMTGLGRAMPATMGAFTVAALAMVGVPPLAGFFSKLYLVQAGIAVGDWLAGALVLAGSLLTAAYLARVVERAYLAGDHEQTPPEDHQAVLAHAGAAGGAAGVAAKASRTYAEAPLDMVVPTVLLAAASIAAGLANVAIMTHVLEPGVLAWMVR